MSKESFIWSVLLIITTTIVICPYISWALVALTSDSFENPFTISAQNTVLRIITALIILQVGAILIYGEDLDD